jgi:hypothetical protein
MKFAQRLITIASVSCLSLSSVALPGCGEEEEVVEQKPVVQSGPRWSIEDLSMDLKVQFPEKYAPESEGFAQAIADFASAIATGDHSAFGSMLAPADASFLEDQHSTGQWQQWTDPIRAVRIVNINDGESIAQVAIAIGTESEAYLTAWSASRIQGDQWQFSALPVGPRTTSRVAQLDDASFTPDAIVIMPPEIEEPVENPEEGDDFGNPPDDFSNPPSSPSSPGSPSSPSSPSNPASPFGN